MLEIKTLESKVDLRPVNNSGWAILLLAAGIAQLAIAITLILH